VCGTVAEKNMFKYSIGQDGQDSGKGKKMLDLLTPKDSPNGGNGTTDLIKYNGASYSPLPSWLKLPLCRSYIEHQQG
jgi:hypothetical protein